MQNNINNLVSRAMSRNPQARAEVRGSAEYPGLRARVSFWQTPEGVLVAAEAHGLPEGGECGRPVFALHIHAGETCTGTEAEPFKDADGHFNPGSCPHPEHAGDLPPLFSNGGDAWLAVLTDRFRVHEVLGRAVIIHAGADDFKTQPSGAAGPMIACGRIIGCGMN